MPRRRSHRGDLAAAASLATRSLALGVAAPQVIAHRLTRIALAGARPTAEDHRESVLMVSEKLQAFQTGWQAMWMEALAQQAHAAQAWWLAPMQGPMAWMTLATRTASPAAIVRMLDAGLAPVHDKAVANARRLSRRRPRG